MALRPLLAALLAATSVSAYSETDGPSAVQFVASAEVMIEACAAADGTNAERYRSLRRVLNGVFARQNYASFMGRPEYQALHQSYQNEAETMSVYELLAFCKPMLRLHDLPQGIAFYD